jgi:hypothetical protein
MTLLYSYFIYIYIFMKKHRTSQKHRMSDDGESASGMTREEHLIRRLQHLEEGRHTNDAEDATSSRRSSTETNKKRKRSPDQAPMVTPAQVKLVYDYLVRGGQLGLVIMAAKNLGVTANGVIETMLYFVASIADTGAILVNAAASQVAGAGAMCMDVAVVAGSDAGRAAAHTVSTLAQYFTFENAEFLLNAAVGACQGAAANAVYSKLCQYSMNRHVMFEDIADTINRLNSGIVGSVTALQQFEAENLLLYTPMNGHNPQPSAFITLADTCAAGTVISENLRKFEQMVHRVNAHALTNEQPPTARRVSHRKASSHFRPDIEKLLQKRNSMIVTNVLLGRGLQNIRANTHDLQAEINKAIREDRHLRTLTKMLTSVPRETASQPIGGGRRTKTRYPRVMRKGTHKRRPRRTTHKRRS